MSLKTKVILLVAVISVSAYTIVGYVFLNMGQKMVADFEAEEVKLIENFVGSTLIPIMLNGSADLMPSILESYKDVLSMEEITIIRVDGKEAFSDDVTLKKVNKLIGWEKFTRRIQFAPQQILPKESKELNEVLVTGEKIVTISEDNKGNDHVRMVIPFLNNEECHICHDSDHEIRGILVASFSMASIETDKNSYLEKVLSVSAILILFLTFSIYHQFGKIVLTPIEGIVRQINGIVKEERYDSRLNTDREDEIGAISVSFNNFISAVEEYRIRQASEKERLEIAVLGKTAELSEKNRIIEDDLKIAQRVQKGLLPEEFPTVSGFEFYVSYQPCLYVSGDFYDIHEIGKDYLGVFISDATGHGSSAALMVSIVKTLLVSGSWEGYSTVRVVERINDFLYHNTPDDIFTTLFHCVIEKKSGKMKYTLAGHPSPLIHNFNDNSVEQLEQCGGMVGSFKDTKFCEKEFNLKPGSRLLSFTDGLIDATDMQGNVFGENRLEEILRAGKKNGDAGNAENIVKMVNKSLKNHTGGESLEDDVTILVLDFDPKARA
jgi:serine phosphatase RsbU (regulator of sigma subunit)